MSERFAEECHYWKTSKSSPDVWLDKTCTLVERHDGQVLASGFGLENTSGRAAYMLRFRLGGEVFHIIWPVLTSSSGDALAARRQAATMMHHDVKAKLIAAEVLGPRMAFFSWLELPDGRKLYEITNEDLLAKTPRLLVAPPD